MVDFIEPMVNRYTGSKDFGKAFGIRVVYRDGTSKVYAGNYRQVLGTRLSKDQRDLANRLCEEIERS